MDASQYEPFLLELAVIAARETLPRFRAPGAVDDKGGTRFDPVTEADRAAEAAIRRAIAERFSAHGVLGEEYGADRDDADHVWVIDPIDGTRAYIAGVPVWTTLIALRFEGRPVIGMIAQPYLHEIYIGGAGLGARLHHRAVQHSISTRTGVPLGAALAATTDPALFTLPERAAWDRLAASTRLARLGLDAYAFAQLAAGNIDVAAETGLKPWDVEAPRALIEGAGGVALDWHGAASGQGDRTTLFAGDMVLGQAAAAILDQRVGSGSGPE